MNKPFYSKRRLKKMGVKIENKKDEIEVNILSVGGSIHQSQNILKMIKASDKPVRINMDSMVSSVASFICNDIDRMQKNWVRYE
jgi:ATP-dependent protease ClpP protease subunit